MYDTVDNQFPGYPTSTLPDLTGFEDCSWHNDTCPSWRYGQFIIWIEWPSQADREFPGGYRYIVAREVNNGHATRDFELETNNWAEVLAHLKGKTQ